MSHHDRATLFVAASLVAGTILSSCASPSASSGSATPDIAGSRWAAQSIAGSPAPSEGAPTLAFGAEYRVSGNTGCNDFFGVYSQNNEGVALQGLGAQERACAPEIMTLERTYLDVLSNAQSVLIDAVGQLVVTAADGRQVVMTRASGG